MPVSSTIHRDPDLRCLRIQGLLSNDEVRRQFNKAPDADGFYPGIPTLVDLSGMTGTEMNLTGILTLRDRMNERHGAAPEPMKLALLVESETAFGIARIVETVFGESKAFDVRIFVDSFDALAFLDLENTRLARLFVPGAKRAKG